MIDGIKRSATVEVDLSEFFEKPTSVWVRKYTPAARAQIREVRMRGVRIDDVDSSGPGKPKVTAVPVTEGSADRDMESRRLKLQFGVSDHTMTSQGVKLAWDKSVWDELDEANPAILDTVIDAIDQWNGGEEEATPT